MATNLLLALINLINNPITNLVEKYKSTNRANRMGDALETYIKDLFCNSFNETDLLRVEEIYSKEFSYTGNARNPPDLMIRGGDSLEVKKIEKANNSIALNSSYPKNKLYADSPMITKGCRLCEKWDEKDFIYVIGIAEKKILHGLWFIYGDCLAADREIYEDLKNQLSDGINHITGVNTSSTKEIGKVKKVDPLGITLLRVRGMWVLQNPFKVFKYISQIMPSSTFFSYTIMLEEKYNSFPIDDRRTLESLISDRFTIENIKIKSPNNPADLLNAKLLCLR